MNQNIHPQIKRGENCYSIAFFRVSPWGKRKPIRVGIILMFLAPWNKGLSYFSNHPECLDLDYLYHCFFGNVFSPFFASIPFHEHLWFERHQKRSCCLSTDIGTEFGTDTHGSYLMEPNNKSINFLFLSSGKRVTSLIQCLDSYQKLLKLMISLASTLTCVEC